MMENDKTIILVNDQFSQERAHDMIKEVCKSLINFYNIQAWVARERNNGSAEEYYTKVKDIEKHKEELLSVVSGIPNKVVKIKMTIEVA